jgi:3'-phosphoadenosine 5'-phosphosulfate sulfotransferase (PAPS reductase)/FAD synthetase
MFKNKIIVCWWSGGVTSALACKLAIDMFPDSQIRIIFFDTHNEHPDTYRFMVDCQEWYGIPIETYSRIPTDYKNIREIWYKYLSLNVANGAICSSELKRDLRLKWEKENVYDYQVFGFDIDEPKRAKSMALNHEQANSIFPLLFFGYTKKKCIEIVESNSIEIPITYHLGFHNNNCFQTGCIQGGIGYWQKMKVEYPEKFYDMAKIEHELTDLKGEQVTMLKNQTKAAKKGEFKDSLIFLVKHPDYPQNICIDDKPTQKVEPLFECNGFCYTNDLKVSNTTLEIAFS